MFDITTESTLSLADACTLLPRGRNKSRPHLSTLVRWITSGVRTVGGEVIRLEAVRLGSKWVTSREALARFVSRLTPALDQGPAEGTKPRSPAARDRASRRAERALAKIGI
jgi:hypothetical protein